jgi:periplasmic divalent cation tolerance protein
MTEEFCEVIITADSADWLAEFTRMLVEDRLAACGQNIATIRSIYRWKGVVEDESEARVALHTRMSLVPVIVARTKLEHPYDVPCVIALPIKDGNPDYLAWIAQETQEPR